MVQYVWTKYGDRANGCILSFPQFRRSVILETRWFRTQIGCSLSVDRDVASERRSCNRFEHYSSIDAPAPENKSAAVFSVFFELFPSLADLFAYCGAGTKTPNRFDWRVVEFLHFKDVAFALVPDTVVGLLVLSLG